ncbi:hypothetical protein CEXT_662861 [Caerostris extrusa]|uniref:Uncharacterized protein n=1 Tax=Caerostris extrusa TaxID=172846 RepID=A0AAV4PWY5_CAEEX|nr:hypothetical protein CEXT_662861 [Caerostris extrusa]
MPPCFSQEYIMLDHVHFNGRGISALNNEPRLLFLGDKKQNAVRGLFLGKSIRIEGVVLCENGIHLNGKSAFYFDCISSLRFCLPAAVASEIRIRNSSLSRLKAVISQVLWQELVF